MYTHSSLILASRQSNRYVCIRSDSVQLTDTFRVYVCVLFSSTRIRLSVQLKNAVHFNLKTKQNIENDWFLNDIISEIMILL